MAQPVRILPGAYSQLSTGLTANGAAGAAANLGSGSGEALAAVPTGCRRYVTALRFLVLDTSETPADVTTFGSQTALTSGLAITVAESPDEQTPPSTVRTIASGLKTNADLIALAPGRVQIISAAGANLIAGEIRFDPPQVLESISVTQFLMVSTDDNASVDRLEWWADYVDVAA